MKDAVLPPWSHMQSKMASSDQQVRDACCHPPETDFLHDKTMSTVTVCSRSTSCKFCLPVADFRHSRWSFGGQSPQAR